MNYDKLIKGKTLFAFFCFVSFVSTKLCGQNFSTTMLDEGIEISENGKKVLIYQNQPKSLDGKYERAGYVHPLYDLNEKILTEDFPADHPYHRGIFWAWHQIILGEKKIADGWMCENIVWEPKDVAIKKYKESVKLQSQLIWKCVIQHNEPTAIIKENTRITVYKSTGQYRAIDFDISLSALVDGIKIGGSDDAKGYGGFCMRLKLPDDLSFMSNNKAITPTENAVTAGPWMNITGSFDGRSSPKSGVAVFCKQPVANNQQPWILRKVTSMQNIPYPGRTPVALSSRGLRFRYRIIIHNADLSNDELEKLYQQYFHKP